MQRYSLRLTAFLFLLSISRTLADAPAGESASIDRSQPQVGAPGARKEADKLSDAERKLRFEALQEEGGGWQGYGSSSEAEQVLKYALDSAPTSSHRKRYEHYWYATTEATKAAGGATRLILVLDTLRNAGSNGPQNDTDRARVFERGIKTVLAGPRANDMQSILTLGLEMTRGELESTDTAYRVMFYITRAAKTHSRSPFTDMLTWMEKPELRSSSDFYAFQKSVSTVLAYGENRPEDFLEALAQTSLVPLSSDIFKYHVMWYGLDLYMPWVADPTHKALCQYVRNWGNKSASDAARRLVFEQFAQILTKVRKGELLVPAVLRAGLELSNLGSLSANDRHWAIRLANDLAATQTVPASAKGILNTAASSAGSVPSEESIKILRSAASVVLSLGV